MWRLRSDCLVHGIYQTRKWKFSSPSLMNGAKLTLFLAVNISAQNTTTCAESANKIPGFNFQGAYTALSYPRFKIGAARE